MKQTERFARQLSGDTIGTGHIAARPAEARHKPKQDWVNTRVEHNRNCGIRCPCSSRWAIADSCDDGRLPADQISRQRGQMIYLAVSKSKFNFDILAFDKADGIEALPDCR